MKITVTASPSRGLERTLRVVEGLASFGYAAVPHLSARLMRDGAHLEEVMLRLQAADVREVFVIAGDARQQAGEFADAAGCSPRWGSSASTSARSASRAHARADLHAHRLRMVPIEHADLGTELEVERPEGTTLAVVVEKPFIDPKNTTPKQELTPTAGEHEP